MADEIGKDDGAKQGMADIVTALREQSQAPALRWLTEAADEIERLRAASDALAKSLAEFHDPFDELRLLAWQEARRG